MTLEKMTLEKTKNLKNKLPLMKNQQLKKVCGNLLTQSCRLLFYGTLLIKVCPFLIC